MTIQFQCPHCGALLRVKPELAGRTGKCKGCSKQIVVPAAPAPDSALEFDDLLNDIPQVAPQPVIRPIQSAPKPSAPKNEYLAAAEAELAEEQARNAQENKTYVDRLIDASPGSRPLKEASGMNIDLSKLTVAGWCLALITIVFATIAGLAPLILLRSSGERVAGGVARAIAMPILLGVGGGTFWIGRRILEQMHLPVVRD